MNFHIQEYYHGVVVHLGGRFLGSRDGERFQDLVDDLSQSGKHKVVVDLSKTELMDSTGLGTLISARTKLQRSGGDLVLSGIEKRIRGLFLMTHLLGSVFEDYPSTEDALATYAVRSMN